MDNQVAITVDNISKTFKLPHEKSNSVKSVLINMTRPKKGYEIQQALKSISFEVKKGEFFGIVGRNGSGKSTLLKLLAGIYSPDSGSIHVNGKLTPFIELGVGFNPELTGRENVFLNGALLGFNRKEMKQLYDDIVEFAEIEKFMDQKLKNYSSGMQVRLAFSIAIRVQNDILVLDEVLAVGDENFQNKCIKVFEDIKKSDRTVILVTHDMNSVKRFCDRALLIHDSKMAFIGDPGEAALEYTKKNFPETVTPDTKKMLVKVHMLNKDDKDTSVFSTNENVTFTVEWPKKTQVRNAGIAIFSESGEYVFGTNTMLDNVTLKGNHARYSVKLNLGNGRYYVQVGLFGREDTEKIYFVDKAAEFSITSSLKWQGLTHLEHQWSDGDV
jgi:ABC-2 type transport system ATP-binding protein